VPKEQIEHWIDEPFEAPHYPSEADMHNCACVEWNGKTGEDEMYELHGPLTVTYLVSDQQVEAPDLDAERLRLHQWSGTEYANDEVFLDIATSTHNGGEPDNPTDGVRLYVVGTGAAARLWLRRSDGTEEELGAGGISTSGMWQLDEVVLTSDTASIAFGSIVQTYRNLLVVLTGRTDAAQTYDVVGCRFNADTGDHYNSAGMYYIGGELAPGVEEYSLASSLILGYIGGDASEDPGMCGAIRATVFDYARTVWAKCTQSHGMRNEGFHTVVETWSGGWSDTAAVTSMTLAPIVGANFLAGTVATLYGLA
jgi:hypothetical protein